MSICSVNIKHSIVSMVAAQKHRQLKTDLETEMEKRADGADASVLFFLLGCANFLAVYVQIR